MSNNRTDVNQLGEFGLIDHLTTQEYIQKDLIKGIGDDAAVWKKDDHTSTVVSTDMLVENIHFDLSYTPLKHLGYKSVVVNLSDIYAMNAIPKYITVSLAISNRYSVEALEQLYEGIYLACKNYQVDLVGGDTTSSNKGLIISITAVGEQQNDKIAYRSGAKVGDLICISGDLGASYLGLQLLEREKQLYLENPNIQPDLEGHDYCVGRLLKPEARKDMIEMFGQKGLIPTSMIDVSDGLASELFHICKASGVGAYIEESGVPIKQESELLAIKFKHDPITCALNGGEDYELLFTVDPKDLDIVKFLPDIYIAGEIVDEKDGIRLHTQGGNIHDIKAQGWNHFKP